MTSKTMSVPTRVLRTAGVALAVGVMVPSPAAATSPELMSLESDLRALVSASSSQFGIAALDLRDGSAVAINGDAAFPMASTVKLAIAGAYLSEVDGGRRSLDDKIGGLQARRLLELMMVRSDNFAADRMLAAVGGPTAVQQWLSASGVNGIRVDRTISQLLRDHGHLDDSKDVATPNSMISLLAKLNSNALLMPQSRALLFELMARCMTGSHRIRALLPMGTVVEDKTGTLNGITNDVGVITMPDGRRIAVAVFVRGGQDRQAGIAAIARAIYNRFADSARNALTAFMRLQ